MSSLYTFTAYNLFVSNRVKKKKVFEYYYYKSIKIVAANKHLIDTYGLKKM